MTSTNYLAMTDLYSYSGNGGMGHGPFRLSVPSIPQDMYWSSSKGGNLRSCRTGYSKWILPIHLGTPALSNIHPHHLIQLTTIAPFYIHVSKTYSYWSWGMNYSLSGPLFELLSYHDVKVCVAQWSQELCCWGHLLLVGSSKANWSWVRDQGPQV